MRKTFVSLSFDDGRTDNYAIAFPMLKKYGLAATFNVTTGFIDRLRDKGWLTPADPMDWAMVEELHRDPSMEIAGHGHLHRNTLEDILEGAKQLKEHLDGFQIRGFASPGTGLSLASYQTMKETFREHGIAYVRLSQHYRSLPALKTFIRKVSRVIPLPILYRLAYQDTLMNDCKDGIVYSVPVLSPIPVGSLKALIAYAEKRHLACVLMFHSIVEKGEVRDNWDYERDKFEELCAWLADRSAKGALEVATTWDVYQHLKED